MLDNVRAILDIFLIVIALPATAFKIWRKLDERLTQQDFKLSRIEYAIFNEGRGIEQQVKEMHTNQQVFMTDVAVLKAQQA